MAFSAIGKAPGVYMQEEKLAGPIAGVSTSTAAFVGPALKGPVNEPSFLTNWSQFENKFGSYFSSMPVYATHAVKGFFDNGGTACYFVRVSTASTAKAELVDRSSAARKVLVVTAKEEGSNGRNMKIEISNSSPVLATTTAVKPQVVTLTSIDSTNKSVVYTGVAVTDYIPGDTVVVLLGSAVCPAEIAAIEGTRITFKAPLSQNVTGTGTITMQMDDTKGKKKIRIASAANIQSGTYLKFTQGSSSPKTETKVVESIDGSFVTLTTKIENSFTMTGTDALNVESMEFTITIKSTRTPEEFAPEVFANLSMEPCHSRYFAKIVGASRLVNIILSDPPTASMPPENMPVVKTGNDAVPMLGGQDDNASSLTYVHYNKAIDTLERVEDVNILCVPDSSYADTADQVIHQHMLDHCQKMGDRFAVLDSMRGNGIDGVKAQCEKLSTDKGFGAIYYPWIVVVDPFGNGKIKLPPSGQIAGLYARTDNDRGVHKAPANDKLIGALGLEQVLTDEENGPLNEKGINVLRAFPGKGIVVWGARTITTSNTQWRYVNVRRLMLYIEKSIQVATREAVFEPNNPSLWATVKRQVSNFLTDVWRNGALFGTTADKAFAVRVDEELNPPTLRALGQLMIEVTVYPVTPAEFIVFRVIQQPGGPSVQE